MAAGMGTVAMFLALLVLVMQGTGAFFERHAQLFEEQPSVASPSLQPAADEKALVAAAIAAVTAHRRR